MMKGETSPIIRKALERNLQTRRKFEEKSLDPQGFCLVPFTNIILEPGGDIGVCRHKGTEFIIGNVRDSSISDIWNNHFIQGWRKEFLEHSPSICAKEIAHQKCNLCPHNNELLDFVDFNSVQSKPFLKLTANLNGFCNLKCQMCHVWKLPNGFYNEENFWRPGREGFFANIKEVDMLSGEPFLQDDTFRLIDEISMINPDCSWMFTTNAHWSFNEKLRLSLDKIKIKYIVFSVDSLDEVTYHKIRYPGRLSTVLKTIESLLEYNRSRESSPQGATEFHLNFLAQRDNWREIPDVISYCLNRSIFPFITFLYEPDQFSMLTLTEAERCFILEHWFSIMTPLELNLSHRVLLPMIQSLSSNIQRAQFFLLMKERFSQLSVTTLD
jgi:MoaA/NifB/PqqE/SkfB family radical SAM enzyme